MPRDATPEDMKSAIGDTYDRMTLELERIEMCASILEALAEGQPVSYEHAEYLAIAIRRHHAAAMEHAQSLHGLIKGGVNASEGRRI